MKKLTSEEFDSMPIHGRGSASPFYRALVNLKPGEGLIIYKTEWRHTYPPTRIINRVERKFGYRYDRGALPDRSGWAVKRLS